MERKNLLTRQIREREAERSFEGWRGISSRMDVRISVGREEREGGENERVE